LLAVCSVRRQAQLYVKRNIAKLRADVPSHNYQRFFSSDRDCGVRNDKASSGAVVSAVSAESFLLMR